MEPKNYYSLCRLITALASDDKKIQADCPELRMSREELEHGAGRPARWNGALLPPFQPQASGLDSKTNTGGGYITQMTLADSIAQAIRAQSHVFRLGAQLLPAGVGGLQFPVAESGSQTRWIVENPGSDAAQVDPVFSARIVTPHALVTSCTYSRQLLTQARADLEQFVIQDIGRAISVEIDRVAIMGSGSAGEPVGVINNSNVPIVALNANGANPSADDLAHMEETVGLANFTPTGFLLTPSLRRRFRKTPNLLSTGTTPLWSDDTDSNVGGSLLGYPARTSTNVPSTLTKGTSIGVCHAILHGDFSQIIICIWDHEITVDPFAGKKQGMISVSIYTSLDLTVLRPTGLVLCLDALA
ncbi:MAG: phage major capsid protein [Terriglobales bacterium]